MRTDYGIVQHLNHGEQAEKDAVGWQDALSHFQTDREREAYRAGFRQAWGQSRAAIMLHAGLEMRETAK